MGLFEFNFFLMLSGNNHCSVEKRRRRRGEKLWRRVVRELWCWALCTVIGRQLILFCSKFASSFFFLSFWKGSIFTLKRQDVWNSFRKWGGVFNLSDYLLWNDKKKKKNLRKLWISFVYINEQNTPVFFIYCIH